METTRRSPECVFPEHVFKWYHYKRIGEVGDHDPVDLFLYKIQVRPEVV